ncbi:MAG: tRNA lysidine(34) synthetase TilS [Paracoccaceae bacterium]
MSGDVRQLHEVAANLGIPKDQIVGVAVSGGSDSLAMLHLFHAQGWSLEAATVDHGLRPEAADEAAYVAAVCAALGVPHETLRVDLSDVSGNLQDQSRRARYAALRAWAGERGIRNVALGHTLDDQAETFLMRLARGSGIDGLSGMRSFIADGGVTWQRPFLCVRRVALRDYLRSMEIAWIEDPSNDDDRFDRVKMRKALQVIEPLGVTPERISDVIRNLSHVRLDLDVRARDAFDAHGVEEQGDVIFRFPGFREATGGLEVLRRSFASALRWVSGADYPPRSDALVDLIEALRRGETRTLHGCVITSGREARIMREYNAVKDLACPTDQLWDGRWTLVGPHDPTLEIRALGEAVKDTPWRDTGLPRQSLLASPAIWRGEVLIAAPVAGLPNGWTAEATGRGKFTDFLISR